MHHAYPPSKIHSCQNLESLIQKHPQFQIDNYRWERFEGRLVRFELEDLPTTPESSEMADNDHQDAAIPTAQQLASTCKS